MSISLILPYDPRRFLTFSIGSFYRQVFQLDLFHTFHWKVLYPVFDVDSMFFYNFRVKLSWIDFILSERYTVRTKQNFCNYSAGSIL